MPSRRGLGSSIISIKLSLPNNKSGRAEWRLYSVNGVHCWDWHWIRPPVVLFAIGGTWSLYMELVRERIDAGSAPPVLDLSNGTGTGEAIGLIGRVSPTGMWSSRSYLRKD